MHAAGTWTTITYLLLSLSVSTVTVTHAAACPYCGPTPPSLTEQVDSFEAVFLGKFVSGEKPNRQAEFDGTTQFEIVSIVKGSPEGITVGESFSFHRYRHGSKGDLVLLMGNKVDDSLKWTELVDMTQESFDYMVNAPGLDVPVQQRLVYFLEFLEHPNSVIAADAFSEFAVAAYRDIVPLAPLMDSKRIRDWLENPDTPPDRVVRTGFYGLILGLCGDENDAAFLKKKLLTSSENYKFGIDGMTSGYLLLSGKQGFATLQAAVISNPESTQTDLFQVLQALRFIWTYDRDRLPRDELFAAMRSILDRPEIADMAIKDLARWKDWDSMNQILSLYGKKRYDDPHMKRAIIRYLMTAKGSIHRSDVQDQDSHVAKATMHLERLKKEDPKLYQQEERYFFE